MGYYYDTVLALTEEADTCLINALQLASTEINELFAAGCDKRIIDPETNAVLYHWDYSKWDEVESEFVNSFLESQQEESFRYIRLGESYGDVSAWGELEEPFDPRVDAKLIYNSPISTSKDR